MTSFSDLEFKPHPAGFGGVQALITFSNGYGASVIRALYSYGGDDGLYELAVLKNDKCVYNTPIACDVVGHLTAAEVTDYLRRIEALDE